jgi:hypothetical protein
MARGDQILSTGFTVEFVPTDFYPDRDCFDSNRPTCGKRCEKLAALSKALLQSSIPSENCSIWCGRLEFALEQFHYIFHFA